MKNRILLTFGLVLMDVGWLYPWSVLVGQWTEAGRGGGLLSAPSIFAVLLAAALSTHLLGRQARRNPRVARVALAVLAVLAAGMVVRFEHYPTYGGLDWLGPLLGALARTIGELSAPVLGFALALYLWWRGVRLGLQTPGFGEIEGAFRWGIGRLALFALVVAVLTRADVRVAVEGVTMPYVVGFFFFSLLLLALGRLESLRTRTRTPSLNTQWLAVLVVVAGSVVLLALLLGSLISFDVLLQATRPLFDLLGLVVLLLIYAIVIPLAWVIQWLVYLLISLIQPGANRPPPEPPQPSDIDNVLQRFFNEAVSPELLAALKAIGAAALVIVALVIVARGLSRWRPSAQDADATNEERESLWNARRARQLLLAWLRHLFRRRAPEAAAVAATAVDTQRADAPRLTTVRAMYAHLLRLGESAGARREISDTPLEHEASLEEVLEPTTTVEELTRAYLRVRYAEQAVDADEVAALGVELEQLQPKGAAE